MINAVKNIITLLVVMAFALALAAQDRSENKKEPLIVLRGKVSCLKPEKGPLLGVTVFNINKDWGTITDVDGNFTVQMGKSDTIILSTTHHKDYIYLFKNENAFKDHVVEIVMEPDAIWLETVTIIGRQNLEEFENEIMQLSPLPADKIDVALPVINKYAKQLTTGEGELVLTGPLTYLTRKFGRYYKIKEKIQD